MWRIDLCITSQYPWKPTPLNRMTIGPLLQMLVICVAGVSGYSRTVRVPKVVPRNIQCSGSPDDYVNIHIYPGLVLKDKGQWIREITGVDNVVYCAEIIELHSDNVFITAELNDVNKTCAIYFTDVNVLNTVENSDSSTLLVVGQSSICTEKFNPCTTNGAICENQTFRRYWCTCPPGMSGGFPWDVPEGWLRSCPGVYLSFDGDISGYNLRPNGQGISDASGQVRLGLNIPDLEYTLIGPLPLCLLNPPACNLTFSVAFWEKAPVGGDYDFLSVTNETQNGNTYAGFYMKTVSAGYTYVSVFDPITNQEIKHVLTDPQTGYWKHYVFTFNSTDINVYINGSFVPPPAALSPVSIDAVTPSEGYIYLGKLQSGEIARANFDFDEVIIFPFVLEERDLAYI